MGYGVTSIRGWGGGGPVWYGVTSTGRGALHEKCQRVGPGGEMEGQGPEGKLLTFCVGGGGQMHPHIVLSAPSCPIFHPSPFPSPPPSPPPFRTA